MEKKVTLYGHIEQSDLGIISERFETGGRGQTRFPAGRWATASSTRAARPTARTN